MLRILFWLFLCGLIYRVVFSYLLPLFHITSAASSQVRRMQEQMREMERKMNEKPAPAPQSAPKKVSREGDYIDYEELS